MDLGNTVRERWEGARGRVRKWKHKNHAGIGGGERVEGRRGSGESEGTHMKFKIASYAQGPQPG